MSDQPKDIAKLTNEETAELAFMRWVANSSKSAWVARRPEAARLWAALETWVNGPRPAWVKCPDCENVICTIHKKHAHDCPCPPL